MNSILLSLGVAIVLALVAALVGPYFIDWSDYRADVEARISEITGSNAVIGGELDIRFLPTGSIDITGLEIQRDDLPFPILIVPELYAEFSLAAFLRGQIEISEVQLTQPIVSLALRDDGSPAFGLGTDAEFKGERVAIGGFTVTDGTLVFVEHNGNPLHTLSGIELTGDAETLAGPIRLEGGFDSGPTRYEFALGTGRIQAEGGVRTKLNVTSSIDEGSTSMDVILAFQDGRPVVDGTLSIDRLVGAGSLDSDVPVAVDDQDSEFDDGSDQVGEAADAGIEFPWKLTGSVRGGVENLLLQDMKIEVGATDRALSLEGAARARLYPAVELSTVLSARQLDLDRFMGGGLAAGETMSPLEVPGVINVFASRITQLEIPLEISLAADGVLLGGNLVEDLVVDLEIENGSVIFDQISGKLPGATEMFVAGTIDPGLLPVAETVVRLTSDNGAALAAWMGIDRSTFGPLFAPGARTKIVFEGGVGVAPDRFTIRDAVANIDGNRIWGGLSYPLGNSPGEIEISLDFGVLDLDRYVPPENVARELRGSWLEGMAGALLAGRDMAVRLTADILSSGDIGAQGLDVNIGVSGDVLTIHQLNIASLSGARFSGRGEIDDIFDRANGSISTRIEIEYLSSFLPFMETVFGVSSVTENMATAFSPVLVNLNLSADGADIGSKLALEMNGNLAETNIEFDGSFDGSLANFADGNLTVNLILENEDGQNVIRQLGLGDGLEEQDGASFNFALEGRASEAFAATIGLNFLGGEVAFIGSYFPGGEQSLSGNAEIVSGDISPVLDLFDLPRVDEGSVPISLKGYVAASINGIEIAALTGQLGQNDISGDLNVDWAGDVPRVAGHLATEYLSMPWLLEVFLGETTNTVMDSGDHWPVTPFDVSSLNTFAGEISLRADNVLLGRDVALEATEFNLSATSGQLVLEHLSAMHGDVNVAADVKLRDNENGRVGASLRLKLDGGTLENYLTRPDGGPYASGPFMLTGQVAGSGRSWRGIIASLSGDGAFQAAPGSIEHLDASAFSRLFLDVDLEDEALELTENAIADRLGTYLEENTLVHDGLDTVFSVSDGILNARNAIVVSQAMSVRADIKVDLTALALESRWNFTPLAVEQADGELIGNVPAVSRRLEGPLGREMDEIDVTLLTGWLGVRRMEQNLAELEQARANVSEQQEQEREALENLANEERASEAAEEARDAGQESGEEDQSTSLNPAEDVPDIPRDPAPESPSVENETPVEPEEIEVSELPDTDSSPDTPQPANETPLGEIIQDALQDVDQGEPSVANATVPVSPATEIPGRQTNAAPDLPPPTSLEPNAQTTRRTALVPQRGINRSPSAPTGSRPARRPSILVSPEGSGMN